MLAVIGGTGLTRLGNLKISERRAVGTPFGDPSAPLTLGTVGGAPVVFLARHGDGHTIPPHQVNYRANLWTLKELGAREILAVFSVGGIRADLGPGKLAVPHQVIDYTWGRAATFFEGGTPVKHVDFTDPYSSALRKKILAAAQVCGETVADGAVYAATQGPRLESAAEIDRLERDGADIVGMTGMPEAALARELGLEYAALAVVVNHAAGRADSARGIDMTAIEAVLEKSMERVRRIIGKLAEK